jgi:hypothetical protein
MDSNKNDGFCREVPINELQKKELEVSRPAMEIADIGLENSNDFNGTEDKLEKLSHSLFRDNIKKLYIVKSGSNQDKNHYCLAIDKNGMEFRTVQKTIKYLYKNNNQEEKNVEHKNLISYVKTAISDLKKGVAAVYEEHKE